MKLHHHSNRVIASSMRVKLIENVCARINLILQLSLIHSRFNINIESITVRFTTNFTRNRKNANCRFIGRILQTLFNAIIEN